MIVPKIRNTHLIFNLTNSSRYRLLLALSQLLFSFYPRYRFYTLVTIALKVELSLQTDGGYPKDAVVTTPWQTLTLRITSTMTLLCVGLLSFS